MLKQVSSLDLLAAPFARAKGLVREGGAFRVEQPWAKGTYAEFSAAGGWWFLECSGESCADLEVRISTNLDPLVLVRGANARTDRLYFAKGTKCSLTVCISGWPGRYAFGMLRLRRLRFDEMILFQFGALVALFRGKKRLRSLGALIRRLREGRAVGYRSEPRQPKPTPQESASWQTYANDEPAVSSFSSDDSVLAFGEVGDIFHPSALALVSEAFRLQPELRVVLADAIEGGFVLPRVAWDREVSRRTNTLPLPVFLRNDGPSPPSLKAYVDQLAQEHPARVGVIALPLCARTRAPIRPVLNDPELNARPAVSAIIPTKSRIDLLEKCLDGLASRTDYEDLEVIVVDNGADPWLLGNAIERFRATLRIQVTVDHGDFNFSRLINSGARAATGEVLLLLNDDVEPIESGWLDRMVSSAVESDVGAVGARLHYPDGTIQHAGVSIGLGGTVGHLWKGRRPDEWLPDYVFMPSSRLAVTGACLVVRRETFESLGGLDERLFPVTFNDIDFCLKLEEIGLRTVYRGDVVLVHHEGQSRGSDSVQQHQRIALDAERSAFRERWRHIETDPWLSPALEIDSEFGVLSPQIWKGWSVDRRL